MPYSGFWIFLLGFSILLYIDFRNNGDNFMFKNKTEIEYLQTEIKTIKLREELQLLKEKAKDGR